ncbi:MAG: AAA family ATPase, partial [Anaerolineae bacterium]|nr:AAA family ATPase [Anaerolineae bacterium]
METLTQALAAAQQGRGQTFFLAGEAGVGKSRLLTETRSHAAKAGFLTLQGHCFEPDLTFPYAPFTDALRAVFATRSASDAAAMLGPLAPVLVNLLPELALTLPDGVQPSPAPDPDVEKRRLFESLAQFFTRLTERQPLLIILEDIHWSDETSLDFLHGFARRLTAFPILCLASYRDEETTPSLTQLLTRLDRERLAQTISLSPLTPTDVEAMIRTIFEQPYRIHSEFLNAIVSLTEGNPFFIEEVLKSLVEAGDIFYTNGIWDRKPINQLRIPGSVQDSVQRRVAQLSPNSRQVLTLAAVIGRRFDFTLLQQLADIAEDELLVVIKEMMAAQLVIEETADQFAFRHALTRTAIYNDLLVRERQTMHRAIAEALEALYPEAEARQAQAANLAIHFYQAADWKKALAYGRQAGEKMLALYAPHAAVEHFSRAVQAAQAMKL